MGNYCHACCCHNYCCNYCESCNCNLFHHCGCCHEPRYKVLMLGIDGGGKTAILYRWRINEMVETIPTIGFNVESMKVKGTYITIWEVGGQPKVRPLWRTYASMTQALIFVIDSTDEQRLGNYAYIKNNKLRDNEWWLYQVELLVYGYVNMVMHLIDIPKEIINICMDYCKDSSTADDPAIIFLYSLLKEEQFEGMPLLILANKQDVSTSMKMDEIIKRLGLNDIKDRDVKIRGCSATTNEGMQDALKCLVNQLCKPEGCAALLDCGKYQGQPHDYQLVSSV